METDRDADLDGFTPSSEHVRLIEGHAEYYHYTHSHLVLKILNEGIRAFRIVTVEGTAYNPAGRYRTEGFLTPMPPWWRRDPRFGSLGYSLVMKHIGRVLLAIRAPIVEYDVYVADFAHILEIRHLQQKGTGALNIGYSVGDYSLAKKAFFDSYVPAAEYACQHIAPVVQILFRHTQLCIAPEFIRIAQCQPLTGTAESAASGWP